MPKDKNDDFEKNELSVDETPLFDDMEDGENEELSLLDGFTKEELKSLVILASPNRRAAAEIDIDSLTDDDVAHYLKVSRIKINNWGDNLPKKKYGKKYKKKRQQRNKMQKTARRINRKTNKLYKKKTMK